MKFLITACVAFVLSGCTLAVHSIGIEHPSSHIRSTHWTDNGEIVIDDGLIDGEYTYITCDRYFSFAHIKYSDINEYISPSGVIDAGKYSSPLSMQVRVPRDTDHCKVKYSSRDLTDISDIKKFLNITSPTVPCDGTVLRHCPKWVDLYRYSASHYLAMPLYAIAVPLDILVYYPLGAVSIGFALEESRQMDRDYNERYSAKDIDDFYDAVKQHNIKPYPVGWTPLEWSSVADGSVPGRTEALKDWRLKAPK